MRKKEDLKYKTAAILWQPSRSRDIQREAAANTLVKIIYFVINRMFLIYHACILFFYFFMDLSIFIHTLISKQ